MEEKCSKSERIYSSLDRRPSISLRNQDFDGESTFFDT